MRSRKGKVYWQTGQDTLKKAASTGPCSRADCNEKLPPASFLPPSLVLTTMLTTAGKEKSGDLVPAGSAAISFGPPNRRSSHFIEEMPRTYWMMPPAFRIFRVNPVMGICGMRFVAIHLPLAAGEISGNGIFLNRILRNRIFRNGVFRKT